MCHFNVLKSLYSVSRRYSPWVCAHSRPHMQESRFATPVFRHFWMLFSTKFSAGALARVSARVMGYIDEKYG